MRGISHLQMDSLIPLPEAPPPVTANPYNGDVTVSHCP